MLDVQTKFEQYHENAPASQIGGTRVEHVPHNQEAYYYREIYINNNNPAAVCRLPLGPGLMLSGLFSRGILMKIILPVPILLGPPQP